MYKKKKKKNNSKFEAFKNKTWKHVLARKSLGKQKHGSDSCLLRVIDGSEQKG